MDCSIENRIAELASRQRGVVNATQLHAAGFDRSAIKRRLRAGRLHRLYRGVYLVGHTAAPEGAVEYAAVLACGDGTVVSHRSAAKLRNLPTFRDWKVPVEVSVAGRDPGRKQGITIYRVRALDPLDVSRVEGIPTTKPARTLMDLASVLPQHDLEDVLMDARAKGLVRDRDLTELLHRSRGRRGAKALRQLIELDQGRGLTRSQAERKLVALLKSAALPTARLNVKVGHIRVDCLWSDQKVIVEVDGYAFHSGRRPFERDRERDAELVARGYVVLRVTWRQLVARPEAVIARIAAALAIRSS